jgi:hypothetical protein
MNNIRPAGSCGGDIDFELEFIVDQGSEASSKSVTSRKRDCIRDEWETRFVTLPGGTVSVACARSVQTSGRLVLTGRAICACSRTAGWYATCILSDWAVGL